MQRRRYLVQADLPSTANLNPSKRHPDLFYCIFLLNTHQTKSKVTMRADGGQTGIVTPMTRSRTALFLVHVFSFVN